MKKTNNSSHRTNTEKQVFKDMKESFKEVFKEGAKVINDTYAPLAGRQLKNGQGKLMATYRNNKRAIEKF